jgi:hypothetical protein
MRSWMNRVPGHAVGAVLLLLTLSLVLAACSTSDLGGTGLGLSGLAPTDLSPTGTPTVQTKDPGGTYAFIYGNQVWIKQAQQQAPKQLTHLALSAATYSWGPIVWSSDGSLLAVALGQSEQSSSPATEGALYIVDTSTGDAVLTSGTSSVNGHAYAWYGPNALFYSNGAGIQFYDYSDPGNPRPYLAVLGDNGPDYSATGNPHFITYGDIAFSGQNLYATRIDDGNLGGNGVVGTAAIYAYGLPTAAGDYSGGPMANPHYGLSGDQIVDLGDAYTDARGDVLAAPWSLASNGSLVFGHVNGVDTAAGSVKTSICYSSPYDTGSCDALLFQPVSTYPRDDQPQFAFTGDGKSIAFGGPSVSTETSAGTGFAKVAQGVVGLPQWAPNGGLLAATQPASTTSQQADQPSIILVTAGKSGVFISGAQGLSWAPQ